MPLTAIQRIHDAARAAGGSSLDQPVYLDTALELYDLVDPYSRKSVYVDVPVASVVTLGRDDFWSPGDTWRSITHRLHGNGWPDAVFEYFQLPTKEAPFPAPSAHRQLKLLVFGGVVECENGNHRLIAARAWLTHKHGDDATLRGVRVKAFAIRPCFLAFLKRAARDGADVLTASPGDARECQVEGKPVGLLLTTTRNPHHLHVRVGDRLIPLKDARPLWQRWFRRSTSPEDRHQWRTIPVGIVEALLDDSWLAPQLATAETWA